MKGTIHREGVGELRISIFFRVVSIVWIWGEQHVVLHAHLALSELELEELEFDAATGADSNLVRRSSPREVEVRVDSQVEAQASPQRGEDEARADDLGGKNNQV